MQAKVMRIFFLTAVVSTVTLGIIYGFSYSCFASEANVPPVSNEDAFIESSSSEMGVEESLPPSRHGSGTAGDGYQSSSVGGSVDQTEFESAVEPSQPEENPDDDFDTFGQIESEWEIIDSGFTVLDSGVNPDEIIYNPVEDLHAVRKYFEFLLFGLLPVSAAVVVVALFCVWFYKTFVQF